MPCREGWRVLRLRSSRRETTEGREPFRRRPIDSCRSTSSRAAVSFLVVVLVAFVVAFGVDVVSRALRTPFLFRFAFGCEPRSILITSLWHSAPLNAAARRRGVSGPYHPRSLRHGAAPFVSFSTGLRPTPFWPRGEWGHVVGRYCEWRMNAFYGMFER